MKTTSLFLAIVFCALQVLFIHSLVLLPDEPFWTSPLTIYQNYVFGLILALSLPFPGISSALFLLFSGFIAYRMWLWFLTKVKKRLVAGNQSDSIQG